MFLLTVVLVGVGFGHFFILIQDAFAEKPTPHPFSSIVKDTLTLYFEKPEYPTHAFQKLGQKYTLSPELRKPSGVFVTLSYRGKPRACWGSLKPEQRDIVQSVIYTTIGAVSKDYRYPPIRQSELAELKSQVTLVRAVDPIFSLSEINPLRDGLMVRSGAKSGIILPGEAKDAHYQMVQSKLKAGIRSGEPFQMYRIKADVFH